MRFRFMLVPPAYVAAAFTAQAANFLTITEAQQLIFPGAQFTPADLMLTDEQVEQLWRISRTTVYRNQVKLWKVSTGGWFFLDQVPGRDDRITYAVGINPDGSIKSIEILACEPGYEQVRGRWREHFVGRRHSRTHLSEEIPNISGTTLSVAHLSDGVTRILATYALFVAPEQN